MLLQSKRKRRNQPLAICSVLEAGKRYLYGGTDLDKAVEQAVSQVKLYLAE